MAPVCLNLELLLVDTYRPICPVTLCLNETLRVLIRTVFPFLILMLVHVLLARVPRAWIVFYSR
jgi:hypothetical protein